MKALFTILSVFLVVTTTAQHTWQRTNPGGGGAIAVVGATASGMIVVASDLSGIYRSTDNGQSFDVVGANQGLLETHVSSFGFDPTDGDTFFAGTYIGLYKTTDGGENFTFVFPTASNQDEYSYVEDIAISASNPSIGYIAHHPSPEANGKVFKTTDGGDSWHPVPNENLPDDLHLVKLMVHPTDANIVYALSGKSRWGCGDADLYRSIDGGVHWNLIGDAEGDILDFDLHPTDPDIIFISTFQSTYLNNQQCIALDFESYLVDDETQGELYKSTNGGSSFSQIGEYTGIISVDNNNPNHITVLNSLYPFDWYDDAGTWQTTNGGASWTHIGFVDNWQKGYSENQYFALSPSFNGLNKTVTKDIFNSNRYYGSYGQWAWGSFDGGVTLNNISTQEISPDHWLSTGVENLNGHCLDINDSNPNVIYMGTWDVGFWVSQDHGGSWTRYQPNYNTYPEYSWNLGAVPVPESEAVHGAGSNVFTLLSDPIHENVVWASFSKEQLTDPMEGIEAKTGLFKSTNYGEDWTLITQGLPSFNSSFYMYGLSLDSNSDENSRTLFLTVNGDVYRSTDDGVSWNLVLANGHLKFTEVDKTNSQNIYAGGKDGLWKSTNGGTDWLEVGTASMHNVHSDVRPDIVPTYIDWSDVENPIYPWEGVFDIETDPNVPDRVYVTVLGPNKGLYRSDNGGASWNQLTTDDYSRGVAIAPQNSNLIYTTSSQAYHSGGYGNSNGIQYSEDGGITWQFANEGMAYNYAGAIEVEAGANPYVWTWSPGTGIQRAEVPSLQGGALVNIKVFLEGPYDENTQMMNDNLRQLADFPLVEPYSSLGFDQVTGGGEATTSSVLSRADEDAIVDWVFVELRDGNNPATVVATQSALLQRDGDVVATDGFSPLFFTGAMPAEVFIVINHRNHFGVRTSNAYPTDVPINVDLTQPDVSLYGGVFAVKVINGKNVLISGDANKDGQVNSVDKNNYWRTENGQPYNYINSKADFNLDGVVNPVDKNSYWRINNSRIEQLD